LIRTVQVPAGWDNRESGARPERTRHCIRWVRVRIEPLSGSVKMVTRDREKFLLWINRVGRQTRKAFESGVRKPAWICNDENDGKVLKLLGLGTFSVFAVIGIW